MTKKLLDPELGELIDIDGLSQLTGIPKSTIRSWRREQFSHLAKIIGYKANTSSIVWYRLDDVKAYLRAEGIDPDTANTALSAAYEAPNAIKAPLGERIDPKSYNALLTLEKIQKDNHWDKYASTHLTNMGYASGYNFLAECAKEVNAIYFGSPDRDTWNLYDNWDKAPKGYEAANLIPRSFIARDFLERAAFESQFWFVWVNTARLAHAKYNHLPVTAEQVCKLPIN